MKVARDVKPGVTGKLARCLLASARCARLGRGNFRPLKGAEDGGGIVVLYAAAIEVGVLRAGRARRIIAFR